MKRILIVGLAAFMFYACGDDDNSFRARDNDSEAYSSDKKNSSSSSDKAKSSSSQKGNSNSSSSESRIACTYTNLCKSVDVVDPKDVVVGELTDERDGIVYKTVKIGNQTWMAENLNFKKDSSTFCLNKPEGCFYTWEQAMDGEEPDCSKDIQGVCPAGWHVPSIGEYMVLIKAVGGIQDSRDKSTWNHAGRELKVKDYSSLDFTQINDSYQFGVYPTGSRKDKEKSGGDEALHWTASTLDFENSYLYVSYRRSFSSVQINYGFSFWQKTIRCIKDAPSSCVEPIPSTSKYSHSYNFVGARTVDPATVEHGVLTDKRDGQTYKTVKIGKQTWMAENLNLKTENSNCYNNESECNEYGRYYSWADAMDSTATFSNEGKGCGYGLVCDVSQARGICPEGWHLPSIEELDTLMALVGGFREAGKNLKSAEGWPDSLKGVDAYGFSLLPAGYNYFLNGEKIVTRDSRAKGILLSSTESLIRLDSPDEKFVGLSLSDIDYGYTDDSFTKKDSYLNVRCLKD